MSHCQGKALLVISCDPTLIGLVRRPGSYTLPGGVATRARGSPFRDSPAATLSGRVKFGSPFGW